jgi:hypothetical protein
MLMITLFDQQYIGARGGKKCTTSLNEEIMENCANPLFDGTSF